MGDGTADGAACGPDRDGIRLEFEQYSDDGRVPAGAVVLLRAGFRRPAVVMALGAAAAPGGRVRVSTGRQVNCRRALLANDFHVLSLACVHVLMHGTNARA
jgi:hypothetical protein